jgi:phospholipase/carboxylesterase
MARAWRGPPILQGIWHSVRIAPAYGGPARTLVVACHGAGANGLQLWQATQRWRRFLPQSAFLLPLAPPRDAGGRLRQLARTLCGRHSWFSLADRSAEAMRDAARPAALALNGVIDSELARLGLSGADLFLAGFSQGGMLALSAGFNRHVPPRGLAAAAATVLETGPPRYKVPVCMVHGEADTVVPPALGRAGEATLRQHGVCVTSCYLPGAGHRMSPQMADICGRFMAALA